MLGLGMDMNRGGYVGLPFVSDLNLSLIFLLSTSEDSGSSNPTVSGTTLFDVRINAGGADYTGSASDYTVTSLTIENLTTGSTAEELLSSPLTMDSTVDVFNVGVIIYVFDNDSPMDDINVGSASGSAHAHNQSTSPLTNNYRVTATVEVNGYQGVATLSKTDALNDSDA